MRNNNSNNIASSSSNIGSNAPFILIIALFIIVFIVVSYFLVSGSAFGGSYVDSNKKNKKNNNSENNNSENKKDKKNKVNEVFNIRDNVFTYNEAKAVCAAHGARLATIEDLIAAYDKGANWCSYGWTQGQLAMYPTQKEYWAKLQMDSKRRTECGEPGLNGGYFENPEFKFGANCFGKKPEPKSNELEKSQIGRHNHNPYENLVYKYKNGINSFKISPFNEDSWSDC